MRYIYSRFTLLTLHITDYVLIKMTTFLASLARKVYATAAYRRVERTSVLYMYVRILIPDGQ